MELVSFIQHIHKTKNPFTKHIFSQIQNLIPQNALDFINSNISFDFLFSFFFSFSVFGIDFFGCVHNLSVDLTRATTTTTTTTYYYTTEQYHQHHHHQHHQLMQLPNYKTEPS